MDRIPEASRLQLLARLRDQCEAAETLLWDTAFILQATGTPAEVLADVLGCGVSTFYEKTKSRRDQARLSGSENLD